MQIYRNEMEKGDIICAYRGLMDFIMHLRNYLKSEYPEYNVPGSIYQGYMDMTYFSLNPEPLKSRKLKIVVVFKHEKVRFEIWLAGYNKAIQAKYWKMFRNSKQSKYYLPLTLKGVDSIIEHVAVEIPDFSNPEALTGKIEKEIVRFTDDVTTFLKGK